MKKIGILGSGAVAKTLGSGFLKHGYEVILGTRDVSKLDEWKARSGGKTGSFADAASFGDIIVLAAKGKYASETLNQAGHLNLRGKTIIDTTNPIDEQPPVNGVLNYFTSLDGSLMEQLQKLIPEAHFVKSFNCVGNNRMVNPDFGGTTPTMFICGNSDSAKDEVKEILEKFGWEIEDLGKAESARAIEPLCMLWCIPGFLSNQWGHAFKLLK